jgi:hypothetical protein
MNETYAKFEVLIELDDKIDNPTLARQIMQARLRLMGIKGVDHEPVYVEIVPKPMDKPK